MKKICLTCEKEVNWKEVVDNEEFDYMFEQADSFGMESLTESKQWVLEGRVCSMECYDLLS